MATAATTATDQRASFHHHMRLRAEASCDQTGIRTWRLTDLDGTAPTVAVLQFSTYVRSAVSRMASAMDTPCRIVTTFDMDLVADAVAEE